MPANFVTVVLLVLLKAAEAVGQLWPYVVAGIVSAALLSHLSQRLGWRVPRGLPDPVAVPLAAALGVTSPVSTIGMAPLIRQLQIEGLSSRVGLTFVLASSLLNPQLFVLTVGGLGMPFALAQLAGVLVLSTLLGSIFGTHLRAGSGAEPTMRGSPGRFFPHLLSLTEHIAFYFLGGVLVAAVFEVSLPMVGVLGWLGERGLLSTPLVGWLGAPFYTCGGGAVPLASGLMRAGLAPDILFVFLLVGPALRGTTLGALACLLPKRVQAACLVALVAVGGLMGYGFGWWGGGI